MRTEEKVSRIRPMYDKASQQVRGAGMAVRRNAESAYIRVGREFEEHPYTSVLTAFGTGVAIGMLLGRRRQSGK